MLRATVAPAAAAGERGETTVKRKRHSAPEIAAKLARADRMTADGMLQRDIARALGVSVMTYHRWRAARPSLKTPDAAAIGEARPPLAQADGVDAVAELERLRIENARLRRLLTDLLLEKAKLEELFVS